MLYLDHGRRPTQSAVNSNIVIKRGMPVVVPVRTLHRTKSFCTDPANFAEQLDEDLQAKSDKFDFLPDMKIKHESKTDHDFVLRLLQTKIGLVSMLHRYIYDLDANHSGNVSNSIAQILLTHPRNGNHFKVSARTVA